MSWTYVLGTLATTPKDQVRLLIGDTDTTEQLLQDEEISLLLSLENNDIYRTGWRACDAIAAEYARKADRVVGGPSSGLRLMASQKFKQYTARALQLKRQSAVRNANVYAGGISISDKQVVEEDTDRVEPDFTKMLEQYPGTGVDSAGGTEEDLNPQ